MYCTIVLVSHNLARPRLSPSVRHSSISFVDQNKRITSPRLKPRHPICDSASPLAPLVSARASSTPASGSVQNSKERGRDRVRCGAVQSTVVCFCRFHFKEKDAQARSAGFRIARGCGLAVRAWSEEHLDADHGPEQKRSQGEWRCARENPKKRARAHLPPSAMSLQLRSFGGRALTSSSKNQHDIVLCSSGCISSRLFLKIFCR